MRPTNVGYVLTMACGLQVIVRLDLRPSVVLGVLAISFYEKNSPPSSHECSPFSHESPWGSESLYPHKNTSHWKKKRVIHDNPKWIQLNYIYKQIQSNYNYKQITKSKQGHFTGTYILGSGGHSSTHNSIQFDA